MRIACAISLALLLAGCQTVPNRDAPGLRDPRQALALNEQALQQIAAEQLDDAAEALRAALAADPYCGPAHCNLGIVLLRQGQFYEAGWQLRYACQLMPKASQPRASLGMLYELVGRYGDAEEELRKALEQAPGDIEIMGQLARVHVRQGKHTDETWAWLQTVATQDDDHEWRRWAGNVLATRRAVSGGN